MFEIWLDTKFHHLPLHFTETSDKTRVSLGCYSKYLKLGIPRNIAKTILFISEFFEITFLYFRWFVVCSKANCIFVSCIFLLNIQFIDVILQSLHQKNLFIWKVFMVECILCKFLKQKEASKWSSILLTKNVSTSILTSDPKFNK